MAMLNLLITTNTDEGFFDKGKGVFIIARSIVKSFKTNRLIIMCFGSAKIRYILLGVNHINL
jgi:hypothetical protein